MHSIGRYSTSASTLPVLQLSADNDNNTLKPREHGASFTGTAKIYNRCARVFSGNGLMKLHCSARKVFFSFLFIEEN